MICRRAVSAAVSSARAVDKSRLSAVCSLLKAVTVEPIRKTQAIMTTAATVTARVQRARSLTAPGLVSGCFLRNFFGSVFHLLFRQKTFISVGKIADVFLSGKKRINAAIDGAVCA